MQHCRPYLTKLALHFLPVFTAVEATEQLAEIGANKENLRAGRVRRYAPQGAVQFARKPHLTPGFATIHAAQ